MDFQIVSVLFLYQNTDIYDFTDSTCSRRATDKNVNKGYSRVRFTRGQGFKRVYASIALTLLFLRATKSEKPSNERWIACWVIPITYSLICLPTTFAYKWSNLYFVVYALYTYDRCSLCTVFLTEEFKFMLEINVDLKSSLLICHTIRFNSILRVSVRGKKMYFLISC